MEHETGQRRAELFDVFVGRLLVAMYPGVPIARNVALANPEKDQPYRSISVDFLVAASERGEPDLVVETKAPYTGASTVAVRNALRHIVTVISRAENVGHSSRAVLAISDALPRASMLDVEQASAQLALRGVALEIWDAERLRELSRGHLDFDPSQFELAVLERFAGEGSRARPALRENNDSPSENMTTSLSCRPISAAFRGSYMPPDPILTS